MGTRRTDSRNTIARRFKFARTALDLSVNFAAKAGRRCIFTCLHDLVSDRRLRMRSILFGLLALWSAALAQDATATLNLWPEKPPGFQVEGGPERDTSQAGKGLVAGKPVI